MSTASYFLLEGLSNCEFSARLHLSPLIQGLMLSLARHHPGLQGNMFPVTRDRPGGSTGGMGLRSGEKDVAAKPLWKMPKLNAMLKLLSCYLRFLGNFLLFFFFLSPKRFDSR